MLGRAGSRVAMRGTTLVDDFPGFKDTLYARILNEPSSPIFHNTTGNIE